jgi:hypothetical protein
MPLVGGIERRLPTRAEMDAAKAYRTPAATTGTLGAATAAATAKPTRIGSPTLPQLLLLNLPPLLFQQQHQQQHQSNSNSRQRHQNLLYKIAIKARERMLSISLSIYLMLSKDT